jgi:hypothetical protein
MMGRVIAHLHGLSRRCVLLHAQWGVYVQTATQQIGLKGEPGLPVSAGACMVSSPSQLLLVQQAIAGTEASFNT